MCLSVDRHCVESEGSLGADQSEHCMAYESHAPSAAVQFSQKELLRNVTAIRDGTAQTPAATASLRRPEPRNNLLLEYKQDFFFSIHFNFIVIAAAACGNQLYETFVYLSQQQRMTHQKSSIYPYMWEQLLAAQFGLLWDVLLNLASYLDLYASVLSTCCHGFSLYALWELTAFAAH